MEKSVFVECEMAPPPPCQPFVGEWDLWDLSEPLAIHSMPQELTKNRVFTIDRLRGRNLLALVLPPRQIFVNGRAVERTQIVDLAEERLHVTTDRSIVIFELTRTPD
ncbi:MAG TPA: hypothetical protein QGF63_07420 [Alphaproteobacteria bacterium]|jgi:hypothetical protein|nr:hypothetical protein [Alphaproteobacteria bacterium]